MKYIFICLFAEIDLITILIKIFEWIVYVNFYSDKGRVNLYFHEMSKLSHLASCIQCSQLLFRTIVNFYYKCNSKNSQIIAFCKHKHSQIDQERICRDNLLMQMAKLIIFFVCVHNLRLFGFIEGIFDFM